MRFPLAALMFLIAAFIFFVLYAVGSLLLTEVSDALSPTATSEAADLITLISTAFGIISVVFFVAGILLIFVLDSLQDEPEMYWRR